MIAVNHCNHLRQHREKARSFVSLPASLLYPFDGREFPVKLAATTVHTHLCSRDEEKDWLMQPILFFFNWIYINWFTVFSYPNYFNGLKFRNYSIISYSIFPWQSYEWHLPLENQECVTKLSSLRSLTKPMVTFASTSCLLNKSFHREALPAVLFQHLKLCYRELLLQVYFE